MVPKNVVLGTPSPTTTPQQDMGTKQQRLKPPLERLYKKWIPKQQPSHLSSAPQTQIHQYTDTIPNFSAGINWHSKEPHKSHHNLIHLFKWHRHPVKKFHAAKYHQICPLKKKLTSRPLRNLCCNMKKISASIKMKYANWLRQ